ncbi:hypothetical protein MRX96_056909 [Rhipicephalus microplus]
MNARSEDIQENVVSGAFDYEVCRLQLSARLFRDGDNKVVPLFSGTHFHFYQAAGWARAAFDYKSAAGTFPPTISRMTTMKRSIISQACCFLSTKPRGWAEPNQTTKSALGTHPPATSKMTTTKGSLFYQPRSSLFLFYDAAVRGRATFDYQVRRRHPPISYFQDEGNGAFPLLSATRFSFYQAVRLIAAYLERVYQHTVLLEKLTDVRGVGVDKVMAAIQR